MDAPLAEPVGDEVVSLLGYGVSMRAVTASESIHGHDIANMSRCKYACIERSSALLDPLVNASVLALSGMTCNLLVWIIPTPPPCALLVVASMGLKCMLGRTMPGGKCFVCKSWTKPMRLGKGMLVEAHGMGRESGK